MALSETLLFYIISTAGSIAVVILGIVYKSKCKIITCCGCLKVERDIDAEERIDEMEISQNHNNSHNHNNSQNNQFQEYKQPELHLYHNNSNSNTSRINTSLKQLDYQHSNV